MSKPEPVPPYRTARKSGRKARDPAREPARNTVAFFATRPFIPPPTREQLMAGSANLRRVYKVEG